MADEQGTLILHFDGKPPVRIPMPDPAATPNDPDFLVPYPPATAMLRAARFDQLHVVAAPARNVGVAATNGVERPGRTRAEEAAILLSRQMEQVILSNAPPSARDGLIPIVMSENGSPTMSVISISDVLGNVRSGSSSNRTYACENGVTVVEFQDMPPMKMAQLSDEEIRSMGTVHTMASFLAPMCFIHDPDGGHGWVLTCLREGDMKFNVITEGSLLSPLSCLRPREQRLCVVQAFEAASHFKSLNSFFYLYNGAKAAAIDYKQVPTFVSSLDRFLPEISTMTHPSISQDVVYFSIESGQLHEQIAAATGSAAAKKSAILAYKAAAEEGRRSGAKLSNGSMSHAWNCYGLALKRAGEFEMAHRAYRWALDDETADVKIESQQPFHNLNTLMQAMSQSEAERRAHDARSVKKQTRAQETKKLKCTLSSVACMQCQKVEPRMQWCSKCKRATYCNAQCQAAHWPAHKPQCKLWR